MNIEITAMRSLLTQAIEGAGFSVSGPTDVRAAENGEPAWVCVARGGIAASRSIYDEERDEWFLRGLLIQAVEGSGFSVDGPEEALKADGKVPRWVNLARKMLSEDKFSSAGFLKKEGMPNYLIQHNKKIGEYEILDIPELKKD